MIYALLLLGIYLMFTHLNGLGTTHLLLQPSPAVFAARIRTDDAFQASRFLMYRNSTFSSSVSPTDSASGKNNASLKSQTEDAESPQRNEVKELEHGAGKASQSTSRIQTLMHSPRNNEGKELGDATEEARNESSSVKSSAENVQSPAHPQKRYLIHSFQGRLGNILFQFAAATCVAELNNLTLVVNNVGLLRDLRHPVPAVPSGPLSPVKHHDAVMGCAFYPSVMKLEPTSSHHALHGYFQTWRYFEPCKTQVKRAILFTDSVINRAVSIVANLREKLSHRTLVGVHMRMEDYLLAAERSQGKKTAPPDYFQRAMGYFRSRFRDVTFVVVASSPTWFRSTNNATDVFMMGRSPSAAVDMEVLSRMDHLIFSVGTFGWWAAYKSNGTVIGYKDFYVPNSIYGRKMNNCTDYFFYPGWILM